MEVTVRFEGNLYTRRDGLWFTANGTQVNVSADFIPRLEELAGTEQVVEAPAQEEVPEPAETLAEAMGKEEDAETA